MTRDLEAAQAIVARTEGRPLSLWQRSKLRAAVRAHEARVGRSLLAEADGIAAGAVDGVIADPRDRAALAMRLDMLDALG